MDTEHNFLLQIKGSKTVYVWDPGDTSAVSDGARELFLASHSRDRIQWREELKQSAKVFHLNPGDGAYMPSTSPHMVECADEPSITMSFTYYTRNTRKRAQRFRLRHRLRKLGVLSETGTPPRALESLLVPLAPVLQALDGSGGSARRRRGSSETAHFASAEIG
jgi:ribosomal protein L16 Arg81 hydroxylase